MAERSSGLGAKLYRLWDTFLVLGGLGGALESPEMRAEGGARFDWNDGTHIAYQETALDVHAPHEPIHGVKDFLLHLLTITVGLLIAVGIEGCVELHREHKLVNEARATMREEIQHNSNEMKEAVGKLDQQTAVMKKNIEALTRIQENPKDKAAQEAQIDADFSIIGLRETAWKTAQTTGALSFMPYAEAQRYSDVYGTQKDFLDQQDKVLEDEAQFLGVMAKTNFGHGVITQEHASLALERFGIWQMHLSYVDLMARVAAETDAAFLEGKEGPHDAHLQLGGGK